MKILFVIDCLHPGGKERRLVELLKGLKHYPEITYELIVMSEDVHYKSIFNFNIPIHFLIRNTKKDFGVFIRLFKLVKRINPDIIQSHSSMTSIYISPIAKLLRIPFINAMVSTATKPKIFNKIWLRVKLTLPFSDIIISNSFAGSKAFRIPANKAVVIHNGFDFHRIKGLVDASQIKKEFGINTKYVVGMVAGFNEHKDYESYISAAKIILNKRNDITFLCVGDGSKLEKTKEITEDNKQIIFTGRRNDIESIVNIFNIGVLMTNIQIHEGISNSIMEYMAFGKPVIASSGGGTDELVEDGKTGFLIATGSIQELVDKITTLISKRKESIQMGMYGKMKLRDEFNIEKMVKRYLNIYKGI